MTTNLWKGLKRLLTNQNQWKIVIWQSALDSKLSHERVTAGGDGRGPRQRCALPGCPDLRVLPIRRGE